MSHLVSLGVQLCKGKGTIFCNECLTIWIQYSILLNRLIKQMIWYFSLGCKAEVLYTKALLIVEHTQVLQYGLGPSHHVFDGGLDSFCHALQVFTTIKGIT